MKVHYISQLQNPKVKVKVEELFLVKLISVFLIIISLLYVVYGGYQLVFIPY